MRQAAPFLALALAGVLFTHPAAAYRPFDGTDAEVAEFGELEIEFGTAYTMSRQPLLLQMPAIVWNLGFWPRFELVLQTNNQLGKVDGVHPIDQLTDTQLLVKAVLREGWAQEKTGPSVALEVGPWLPNPNGEIAVGGSADLIASFDPRPMVFSVNLQAAYDLEHHVEIFGGVIIEGSRDNAVRPVTEIYAQRAFGGSKIYSALAGVIWKARKEADLDLGVEAFSVDSVPMVRVRFGITFAAPLWHGHEAAPERAHD